MSYSSDIPHGADEQRGGRPGGLGGLHAGLLGVLSEATWQVLVTAGLVAIALGVIVLAWPGPTLAVVGALFGVYLLVGGILQLAGAFSSQVPRQLRVLGFVSGALSVLLGLLCFRGPAQSILLLALWIGFGWLLRGVMLTATAISADELPARGWQIALGLISALAGVLLIVLPFGSITALAVTAGVWLLALGAVEVVHGVQLRAGSGHRPARGLHFRARPHPQP